MNILVVMDPVVPISKYETVGSTNVTCQLVKEYHRRGIKVTLAGYWDKCTSECEMSNYSIPLNIYPNPTRTYMKEAFKILNDHLDHNIYDSININISTPSVAKYLVNFNNGNTPVYFTMHSWTGTTAVSFYHKSDFENLIDNDKVNFVFLCESQMRTLFNNVEREPKNYIIEPNAVLGELYNITEEESLEFIENLLPISFIEEGYILSVERFVKSKHPAAIVDVVKTYEEFNLVIVGDKWINDLDYADDVIKEINSADNIFWIRDLPNTDVLKLMKSANCTVLYTDIEVCNLTILESLSVGTPVLFGPSNGTGITDSINNLSDCGLVPIEFPFRSSWEKKREVLMNLIIKTSNVEVKDIPDCYKWKNHVDNCCKIVTNNMKFN